MNIEVTGIGGRARHVLTIWAADARATSGTAGLSAGQHRRAGRA